MTPRIPSSSQPRSVRDEAGQTIVLLAVCLVVLCGIAGLAIDVGHAYYVKRALQASADAAALAGAQELPSASNATSMAQKYSGEAGADNFQGTVPGVQATISTKCVSIAPCNPANAIVVDETTKVSTQFARVLGFDSFDVHARSTACSPCASRPLDVMLVLDRTGSMCMDHWGNYDAGCSDLNNAKQGIKTFLGFMDITLDKVGLAVLPPATSSGNVCGTPPNYYTSASYPYVLVPLSMDYKVTGQAGLNNGSALVSTINCLKGGGSTSYATALEKAQEELDARGRSDVQDVIIFLSDGAANTGPEYLPKTSPYRTQPCHQGVNSAATIKGKGTLIYSIGYDLDALNGGANKCQSYTGADESPAITAYSALQQIASNSTTFYNKPDPGQLNSIYTQIAGDLAGVRLIDNNLS